MQRTAVLAEPDTGPLFTTDSDPDMDEALRRVRQARTTEQVAEVAEHLTEVNPDGPITEAARYTTAVLVAGSVGRVRPLLRALPFAADMPEGATRRDYAQHIRTAQQDGELPPSPIHVPGIPRQPERPDNSLVGVA